MGRWSQPIKWLFVETLADDNKKTMRYKLVRSLISNSNHQLTRKKIFPTWISKMDLSFLCAASQCTECVRAPKSSQRTNRNEKKKYCGKSAFDPTSWILFTVGCDFMFSCFFSVVVMLHTLHLAASNDTKKERWEFVGGKLIVAYCQLAIFVLNCGSVELCNGRCQIFSEFSLLLGQSSSVQLNAGNAWIWLFAELPLASLTWTVF